MRNKKESLFFCFYLGFLTFVVKSNKFVAEYKGINLVTVLLYYIDLALPCVLPALLSTAI